MLYVFLTQKIWIMLRGDIIFTVSGIFVLKMNVIFLNILLLGMRTLLEVTVRYAEKTVIPAINRCMEKDCMAGVCIFTFPDNRRLFLKYNYHTARDRI
jgi:hypothetical protein